MNKNYTTLRVLKTVFIFCSFFTFLNHSFSQNDFDRIQKVVANDRVLYDQFGSSVSISGDLAAIGSPRSSFDANGLNEISSAGAVYIFERNTNGSWIQVAKITAPVRRVGNFFGQDVDLFGQTLIIGSPDDDYDSNEANFISDAGSAFIFEKNVSGVWTFVQKLTPSVRTMNDHFGNKVSVSNNRALVNSPYNGTDASNANPMSATGAVFAFEKNVSGIWNQVLKIVEPIRYDNNMFGSDIDISNSFFVIGSPHNTYDAANLNYFSDAGAAYAYQWGPSGISFFQKIVANDRKVFGLFGTSVAIDNGYIAIGARGESTDENNLNPINFAGAVYAFNLGVTPFVAFHFFDKMVAPDRSSDTQLGYSSIDIINGYIIAGSFNSYDNSLTSNNLIYQSGSSYIFRWTTGYEFYKKIISTSRDENDYFGISVALGSTPDGLIALVGSHYDNQDQNEQNYIDDTGSSFFFGPCVSTTHSITVSDCNNYDFHGNFYTSSGTYVDTIPNAIGCDSIVTINLTIIPLDTTLSYSNGTLTSNASNATFQWVNCQTGLDVPGATNQSFTPSVNGMYKVRITSNTNGCEVESACAVINNAGINENENLLFTYYPNPATNQITIEGKEKIKRIRIYQLTGGLIQELEIESIEKITLDVSNLIKGIYFFQVETSNSEIEAFKISIQ